MDQALGRMKKALEIMKESAFSALRAPVKSMGGLIGGEARKFCSGT